MSSAVAPADQKKRKLDLDGTPAATATATATGDGDGSAIAAPPAALSSVAAPPAAVAPEGMPASEALVDQSFFTHALSVESKDIYPAFPHVSAGAEVKSMEEYKRMYNYSITEPDKFWAEMATKYVSWFAPFTQVRHGSFEHGDVAWYLNGKLNASYNAIDRHLASRGDKVAILWEGDDAKDVRRITYKELLREVCRLANALKRLGVRKGDTVCIYMPMIPEATFAMLACARIGAPHTVVFAGFSSDAIRDRIIDGHARFVITADEGRRGGKTVPLKTTVNTALAGCPDVKTVIVYQHTHAAVPMKEGRDVWYHDLVARERPYCPPEWMDAEDTLFMLFTSGSTGKPKGIQHCTGGYLVYAAMTHKLIFDVHEDDVYACVADVGWITGHSYIVYGPLVNGATTFMFESTPLYPDAGRYWDMVQRHRINIFYTAPTAVRALMKFGEEPVKKYDRSSLRVLGSVGEPINPEAWRWYFDVVGDGKRPIVDTFWQTETGGIMITPLPGCTPLKPGAASFPFFGVALELMDEKGNAVKGNDVKGVLCVSQPWPGMARTCYGDHPRFMNTYLTAYPGYYFTGDGCHRDADGFHWITGRVDDVMSVSGHRIGSAEIESALVSHAKVAESAVVGVPHAVKGQSLFAYVTCKEGVTASADLTKELRLLVRSLVGAFAVPDEVLITPALPKTRSGKIMRRLLRKIACDETDPKSLGDISTLADEAVVPRLIAEVTELRRPPAKKPAA